MNSKPGCLFLLFGLGGVIVLAVGVFLFLNNATQRRLERLQALNAPPDVYITSPEAGTTVQPGGFEVVQVTAAGPNAIERIEIWWDGEKLEEAVNENIQIEGGFSASFSVQVTEGSHMLVARVVDVQGIIGQSFPLGIYGDPQLAGSESQTFLYVDEDQSLEEIAATYAVPVDALAQSNPALAGGTVTAGTQIIFPAPVNVDSPPVPSPTQSGGNIAIAIPDALMLQQVDPNSLRPNNLVLFAGDPNKPVNAPGSPELYVDLKLCKIAGVWEDRSDNELSNTLWLSDFILPGRVIATLQATPTTGTVGFQFDIPVPGNYGIWTEAANALGTQKSAVTWLRIPPHNCASQTARDLEFELVLLDIVGGYDRAYCYVSVEGRSEARIPPWKDSFYFANPAGQSNAPTKNLFSIPSDGVLDLEGECWKWFGSASGPIKIGNFKESIPRSDWNGSVQTMVVDSSAFLYTIQPLGDLDPAAQYAYEDTSLTPPSNVRQEPAVLSIPPETAAFEPQRVLTWEWNGIEDITGFNVYSEGVVVKHVGPHDRKALVTLNERCGEIAGGGYSTELWVSATRGNYESKRIAVSVPLQPCPIEATVEFVSLQLTGADDTVDPLFNADFGVGCSSYLDAYFTLSVSFESFMQKRVYFREDSKLKPALACGTYDFPILVVGSPLHPYGPPPDKVTMSGLIGIGQANTTNVGVGVSMFDDDHFSDDKIVSFFSFFVDSIENWKTYDKTEVFSFNNFPDASGSVTIRVTGQQMQP